MKPLKTIHSLYTSREFRELRNVLMHERTDQNGVLLCEYCHKPILQSYDCIAHHKTEVTTANLNNAEITLNPANIQLVHLKCHNEIHNRFGCIVKNIYYVWGAPCSGKTTFVNANKGRNSIIIDIDNIWEALTGERYFKPDTLKSNVFQIYNNLLDQVRTGLGYWTDAYIISSEPRRTARERACAAIGAKAIYIHTDRETALKRLASDENRRLYVDDWTTYINRFFDSLEE